MSVKRKHPQANACGCFDGGPEGDRTLEPHGCEPCALPSGPVLAHFKQIKCLKDAKTGPLSLFLIEIRATVKFAVFLALYANAAAAMRYISAKMAAECEPGAYRRVRIFRSIRV